MSAGIEGCHTRRGPASGSLRRRNPRDGCAAAVPRVYGDFGWEEVVVVFRIESSLSATACWSRSILGQERGIRCDIAARAPFWESISNRHPLPDGDRLCTARVVQECGSLVMRCRT